MLGSRSRLVATILLCCLLLLAGGRVPAIAESHDKEAVSLDDAIALVREKSGGKVLRAETNLSGERRVHEIRILTDDGHVRTFVVDARTGRVR